MNTGKAAGVVFGLFFPVFLAAQNSPGNFPSLRPDPLGAEYAGRGKSGDYSWEDLAEAALWASALGTAGPQNSANYLNIIRLAAAELEAGFLGENREMAPKARGDYILSYMHRKFLRSYSALQTRLDTLLSGGRYNCVSSAVLYLILARSQGLDVRGVAARDHAFASFHWEAESWDVETTNPYGFDPGSRREFHDQFGKTTGFAYVPARNYRDRTAISPLELVSLILHNRIAEAESRNRYGEAVSLALNRAALLEGRKDPAVSMFFTDPRQDLNDRILNYGASLLNSGKEEEGLAWAALAEHVYSGTDERWQEYTGALVSNRVTKLCRAGRFDQARAFLAGTEFPRDGETRRRLETLIADAELTTLVNALRQDAETAELLRRIDAAESGGLLPSSRVRELRDHVNRWRLMNFHNRFAAAFNKRDYTLARQILEEALKEFPGDRQLRGDQNTLEAAAGREGQGSF
ncbi:MAG: hypothetical protein LBB77_09660 [Treponema sp.]|jgi:hypothetical protein|nr:hypothetical protein [Treponema sp.]